MDWLYAKKCKRANEGQEKRLDEIRKKYSKECDGLMREITRKVNSMIRDIERVIEFEIQPPIRYDFKVDRFTSDKTGVLYQYECHETLLRMRSLHPDFSFKMHSFLDGACALEINWVPQKFNMEEVCKAINTRSRLPVEVQAYVLGILHVQYPNDFVKQCINLLR